MCRYIPLSDITVIHKHTRNCSGKHQKKQQKQKTSVILSDNNRRLSCAAHDMKYQNLSLGRVIMNITRFSFYIGHYLHGVYLALLIWNDQQTIKNVYIYINAL